MSLIDEFIEDYTREYDFYENAARLCAQKLQEKLRQKPILAIVTYRAKRPDRLKAKLQARHAEKPFACKQDIRKRISDFAGVRIALYFPGDSEGVAEIISELFHVDSDHLMPDRDSLNKGKVQEYQDEDAAGWYENRFPGYKAHHFRIRLRDSERYEAALIEIQVASLLMHAWAEVNHDLVYKPLSGKLSQEELAILDQINGLVLTGEVALESLQRAGQKRILEGRREFGTYYDLGVYLKATLAPAIGTDRVPVAERGDIEVLFSFLQAVKMASPEQLNPFAQGVVNDADAILEIIDRILIQRPELYPHYFQALRNAAWSRTATAGLENHEALNSFISAWVKFDHIIRTAINADKTTHITGTELPQEEPFSDEVRRQFDEVVNLRNRLLTGTIDPEKKDLESAEHFLLDLLAHWN